MMEPSKQDQRRRRNQRYFSTSKGKAAAKRAKQKWMLDSEKRERQLQAVREWAASPEGRLAHQQWLATEWGTLYNRTYMRWYMRHYRTSKKEGLPIDEYMERNGICWEESDEYAELYGTMRHLRESSGWLTRKQDGSTETSFVPKGSRPD